MGYLFDYLKQVISFGTITVASVVISFMNCINLILDLVGQIGM